MNLVVYVRSSNHQQSPTITMVEKTWENEKTFQHQSEEQPEIQAITFYHHKPKQVESIRFKQKESSRIAN